MGERGERKVGEGRERNRKSENERGRKRTRVRAGDGKEGALLHQRQLEDRVVPLCVCGGGLIRFAAR